MSAIAAAMIGSAVIGAGAGMYGAHQAGKNRGQTGYDVVKMPQYSFTEPRMRLTSDYLSDNLNRLNRGEYPAYYDKALPQLREGMNRQNYQTFFGRSGERTGLANQAAEVGALTGLGPKGTQAQVSKQYRNYAEKAKQIEEYLVGQGVNIMRQESLTLPQLSMNMPKGPDAQVVNYMGGVGGNSNSAAGMAAAGNMLGNIPWDSFGQPDTTGGGANANYNYGNYNLPTGAEVYQSDYYNPTGGFGNSINNYGAGGGSSYLDLGPANYSSSVSGANPYR